MSEQKEQFEFNYEPIRGYPELRWTGKRPFTGTPYYPAQLKESYGDDVDGWRNKIYWGDNLQVMSHLLKDYRGKVNLIYIDPPFDSKADYKKKIELRGKSTTTDSSTFEEKQYGDIWTNDEYLQFMYERLILCRELLADNGSIYLHCDWHKSHYLRSMLDEIFGYNNFINEIAWHYGTYVGQTKNNYPRKHDTILIYGKTSEHYFCMQRDGNLESDANYKRWKKFFTTDNKIIGSNYPKDDSKFDGYVKRFIKENGREPKTVKDILLDIDGKLVDSVWEIQSINPMSKERTDYPTQKPEELIQRIILSSSQVGDIVFDCFMGSGTTQAVAMKLGRRFLGADINLGAIQTTTKRLLKVSEELNGQLETEHPFYTGFEVYNVNDYDFFRNELEAKRLICEAMGMEQLPDSTVYDALLDGRKVCILGINRIATASEFAKLLNNVNISEWQSRQKENPTKPVEEITFVCMGHDPNLKAQFEEEVSKMGFKIDVEIIDLLRDKKDLRFKRDSDAKIVIKNNKLIIENFFPMNLLQKLSIEKTDVSNWKELAESVFIDWNYDGVTFSPELTDIPEKNELVKGEYAIPKSAGTIHIKITDLISESWEGNVEAE
ncbi:site-specific DNA-methyltransferase [Treponema berlinense]|uniref:site-specific DNA-methyltransferase n=1 Tax=Treponema berlinense TaxID=225004 RepID=UPI002357B270|nr:site-specific DNA-methyltransferase [Treponema berlinense]